jgi:hypothetical protein
MTSWERNALAAKHKHLLVYYNHSCNSKDDPPGSRQLDTTTRNRRFATNLLEIITWMGNRYRDKIKAWWFDSPDSLDSRGPHNSVSTDMSGFQCPWERFTVAAKIGHLLTVTYNAGVHETFLYTTHQDYWAGIGQPHTPAKSRYPTTASSGSADA